MASQSRPFAANVLVLASGTIVAQLVGILGAPIVARLFSPEAFGVAALFAAITALVVPVVCLRYETSILLPETDDEAINALGVSLTAVALTSLVTAAVLMAGRELLLSWLHAPDLRPYLWFVPIAILTGGVFAPLSLWNVRQKEFGLLTAAQIMNSSISVAFQVCAGLSGRLSAGWLITAGVAGTAAAALFLGVQICGRCYRLIFRSLGIRSMWHAARRYERFPRYSVGATLLNGLSWQLPAFFLSGFFSSQIVGYFSLGNRVVHAPMSLLGSNVAKVFAQRAAQARREQTLAYSVETTFLYLAALTLFPCLLLSLIGKELFIVVFSAKWAEAGVYCQILSVWVCVWFISSPLSVVLSVLEEQKVELGIDVSILASRFFSLLAGGLLASPRIALALFSVTGVAAYGHFCLTILKKSGVSPAKMLRLLSTYVAMFAPAGLIILVIKHFAPHPLVVVTAASLLLALYYANLIRIDPQVREVIGGLIHKPARKTKLNEWMPCEEMRQVR